MSTKNVPALPSTHEGYQPPDKRGYQPSSSTTSPLNPPSSGSGVPATPPAAPTASPGTGLTLATSTTQGR